VEGWVAFGFFARLLLHAQNLARARLRTVVSQEQLDVVVQQLLTLRRLQPSTAGCCKKQQHAQRETLYEHPPVKFGILARLSRGPKRSVLE
jgi:hypothetical protein